MLTTWSASAGDTGQGLPPPSLFRKEQSKVFKPRKLPEPADGAGEGLKVSGRLKGLAALHKAHGEYLLQSPEQS